MQEQGAGPVQEKGRPGEGGRQSVKKGKLSSALRIPGSAAAGCPASVGFPCQLLEDQEGLRRLPSGEKKTPRDIPWRGKRTSKVYSSL
jgi:hypothetical protein